MSHSSKTLLKLHEVYRAGNLRVLAGAGTSLASDLPGWSSLNTALLRDFIATSMGGANSRLIAVDQAITDYVVQSIEESLGRDAVAELVYRYAGKDFRQKLAWALYRGRNPQDLYISDLQKQIAALALDSSKDLRLCLNEGHTTGRARLFTTNFDSMLELALAWIESNLPSASAAQTGASSPEDWPLKNFERFRSPGGATGPLDRGSPKVEHLHGWVDPDGSGGGKLVYAESHYVALQTDLAAKPNQASMEVLRAAGSTLFVGASLSDPNLRRLLYQLSSDPLPEQASSIYAIFREDHPAASVISQQYWEALNVQLIHVSEHAEIPHILRQIQWGPSSGGELPKWIDESLRLQKVKENNLADTDFQSLASPRLKDVHCLIKDLYVTQAREKIGISVFSPLSIEGETALSMLADVDLEGNPVISTLDWAKTKRLSIKASHVQGLAGRSFVEGSIRQHIDGAGDEVDQGFDEALRRNLYSPKSYQDWHSLLVVPTLGGPFSVPCSCVCVRSTSPKPFWSRLESTRPKAFTDFLNSLKRAGASLWDERESGSV